MARVQWLTTSRIPVPFSGGGLISLPNNAFIGSSGIDTSSGDLSLLAEIELDVTFGTPPTSNTGFSVWFLRATDGGTQFEFNYGSGGYWTPARLPDVVLPLMSSVLQQIVIVPALIPPGNWKVWAKNDGTGQTTSSSGCNMYIRPLTYQVN